MQDTKREKLRRLVEMNIKRGKVGGRVDEKTELESSRGKVK